LLLDTEQTLDGGVSGPRRIVGGSEIKAGCLVPVYGTLRAARGREFT